MNYLQLIIDFENRLETEFLPGTSQLLWYKLVWRCNKCGWAEWFSAENRRLMLDIKVSREQTFIEARNRLIEANLIGYRRGRKGKPGKYKIIDLRSRDFIGVKTEAETEVYSEVKTEAENGAKRGVNTEAETADIYKEKQKEKEKHILSSEEDLCRQVVALYNSVCVSFPRCTALSEKRREAISEGLRSYGYEGFKALFEAAEESRFLKGENPWGWSATFDWLIKDSNAAKVLDGNYSDKGRAETKKKETTNPFLRALLEMEEKDES